MTNIWKYYKVCLDKTDHATVIFKARSHSEVYDKVDDKMNSHETEIKEGEWDVSSIEEVSVNKCSDCKNLTLQLLDKKWEYYSCNGVTRTKDMLEPIGKNCFVKKEEI